MTAVEANPKEIADESNLTMCMVEAGMLANESSADSPGPLVWTKDKVTWDTTAFLDFMFAGTESIKTQQGCYNQCYKAHTTKGNKHSCCQYLKTPDQTRDGQTIPG